MIAFGAFETSERRSLSEAAAASSVELHTIETSSDAADWLSENDAKALLLSGTGPDPMNLALSTRAQKRHRQLPILALAREPSDLEFTAAFSWGADDVVAPNRSWSVTTRLRAISRELDVSEAPPRGTAVIAEVEQSRRVAMARVLFNGGYDVRFAVTREDTETFALEPTVSLVVLCTELCEAPSDLIDHALRVGSGANFVISAEPRRYIELSKALGGSSHARVTDASAPPENVLFLANELVAGSLANKRQAVRILYGTTVRFRPEGLEEDEIGFSYNVSSGGLYVRTLAPPTEDLVWLELTPPKSPRRVRLVGEVAWRRPFGPHKKSTVPPGFGVRIVDGSKSSLARWIEGCETAAAAF